MIAWIAAAEQITVAAADIPKAYLYASMPDNKKVLMR